MRNILLSFVLLFISLQLSAQPDNWYFSITMGRCWPTGTFADTNPDNTDAGFALSGFSLNLDATYPLSSHWGLKGMVMLNSNPVDRNGMGTMMENRMKEQVPFTETERDFLTLSVNSWMSNSLIFGPVYTINFDRLAWDFQAMTGMNVTYLPDQKLLFANPAHNWEYLQHNTNTINVSMDFSAGTALRMKVTEKIHLKLSADYQYSQSKNKWEELKSVKENNVITTTQLNSGTTTVVKNAVIGSIGFVYYL
jgi:hypothetical protein